MGIFSYFPVVTMRFAPYIFFSSFLGSQELGLGISFEIKVHIKLAK